MAKTDEPLAKDDNQPQPGAVISPGDPPAQPFASGPVPPDELLRDEQQQPQPSSPIAGAEMLAADQPEAQDVPLKTAELQAAGGESQEDQTVTWTASEFIAHDKSAGWYAVLALVTLVLGGGVFLLDRDFISVSVVIIGGLLLGIYAGHQPRALEYALSNRGLSIGQKHYSYDAFKSFSIMQEGAFSNIMFMPLKRFAVAITVHYAPEDEDKILSILDGRLPMEQHKYDAIDTLMRRIRF